METTRDRARRTAAGVLDGTKRWVAGGASAPVIFMLVAVDGEPSCLVLPADGRGGDGWIVGELDKIGYRGVESAVYHFDGFHRAGRRDPRRRGRRGRPADARRARRRPRQRRLPRARASSTGRCERALDGVPRARDRRRRARRPHARAAARRGAGRPPRGGRVADRPRGRVAVDARADDARELSTAAKVVASDTAVWAVDAASPARRLPLLHRDGRARAAAPRRAADADRRGRQRRAAVRARARRL